MEIDKQIKTGRSRPMPSTLHAFVLACFLLSGAASLIYQVLWVRMIDKVVGSAPFAVATVVAIFMGGLAFGSYLAGKIIDQIHSRRKILSLYGMVEVAICVYGLLIPFFIVLVKPIYVTAYNLLFQHFWIYQSFAFLGCALLLIIPTTLMGVTLPVLCRFYVVHLDHIGARTGRLYGINTVGAALGALLCGFVLVSKVGMWGTLITAAAVNLSVGLFCILLSRRLAPVDLEFRGDHASEPESLKAKHPGALQMDMGPDPSTTWSLWIFAVSGFSAMAYEVIWTRLLGLIIGPTTYSFTLVVSAFIVGLAVGSLFFGWLGDRIKRVFSLLAWTQVGVAGLALLISQFFGNSQFFFAKMIYTFQDRFEAMILAQFIVVFIILLGPTVLSGATFPLVNRIYARSLPVIGKSIGTAYALNTIGAILGSIAAGFVLIPFIGKENGLRLVAALQFTTAFLALYVVQTGRQIRQRLVPVGTAVLGLALLFNFPSWNRQILSVGQYRDFDEIETYLASSSWFEALRRGPELLSRYIDANEVVFYADGTAGFTVVTKWTDSLGKVQYALINSGKPDASSHGDRHTQTLLAHVPLLFHPHPEKVMVLGLASGMTAGEVLHYPVRQLDVLEINDRVVEASKFFTPWNNACLTDPRTRIIVQDGRNHLSLTREKYDVIISEPSNPWMAGLANLFTLEFFQTAKDRLRRNGIFVQWIHSYEMDWSTFAMVGRTFTEIFPVSLLMTTTPDEQYDYLLVGFPDANGMDLATAMENMAFAKKSKNIFIKDPRLLFHLIMSEDLKKLFGSGPLHTDNWPRLEFAAPKQLYKESFSVEEVMGNRRWISPKVHQIIEAENRMDVLLDLLEFSSGASTDSSFFESVALDQATPAQKERYLSIVRGYCKETLVTDYSMFPSDAIKAECAGLQAVKIRRHLARNPGDVDSYHNLGLVLTEMGKTKEAVEVWEKALSLNPFDVRAHNSVGAALAREGRLEEAVGHFSQALQARPEDVNAHYNMALALSGMGKLERAVHHYSEVLRLRPGFVNAHMRLGVALVRMERFDEAIEQFSEALRIMPDNLEAHNNLGALLARQEKHEEAVAHFSEVLRRNPADADAHYNMGLTLSEMGKVEQAIHHYAVVLRISPDDAAVHNSLGILLAGQGKFKDAEVHFSEALRIEPDWPEAKNNLDFAREQMRKSN